MGSLWLLKVAVVVGDHQWRGGSRRGVVAAVKVSRGIKVSCRYF